MTETIDTRGVPDSLEFKRGAGDVGNVVYECTVCEVTISGTENARKHTGCPVPGTCPTCDSPRGRVDVAPNGQRVDVCECGTPYREHFDGGVV